jgi:chemotaxis protein histidine kinase CheA
MITDPKIRKFVDFYLSELLTHVKSMIETRFAPLEYNLSKKIIVHITQSKDHLAQVESLNAVTQLSPFTGFLQKIVHKVQQPDFKKSQMISVIETDSEKISQILSQIVKAKENLPALRNELKGAGIDVDVDALLKEPAKPAVLSQKIEKTVAVVKTEKTEKISEPLKQIAVKKTEEPVQKEKTKEEPRILSVSEFKKVDDMIGFLSKRRKKTTSEKENAESIPASSMKIEKPVSGNYEGVASDLEDFFGEFRTEFQRLESSVNQLRTNLNRTRYIIELADSFGEFKRLGKIFELPRFSRLMYTIEKTLIDFADNAGERKSGMNEATFGVLQQIAVLFKEIEIQKQFPLTAGFLSEIETLHGQFTFSSGSSVDESEEVKVAPAKIEEVDAEIMRSADVTDEESAIVLPLEDVAADDLEVFKEEAHYSFDTIRSALAKLKASGSDHDAIKNIQQSFRSLFTGSRLLRFSTLTGHFELIIKQLKTCIDSQNAIAPELLHLIEETLIYASDLTQGESVSESVWSRLKSQLEVFGTRKELPTGDTPAEFKPSVEKSVAAVKTAVAMDKPESLSTTKSNDSWISGFQQTLEEHPFVLKAVDEEKTPEPKSIVPEKTIEKKTVKEEAAQPAIMKPAETPKKKAVETPTPEEKQSAVLPEPVAIPTDLINMMAKGDTDLSELELPTFAEKLNIEPQNIIGFKSKALKKKTESKKKTAETVSEKKDAAKTVETSKPESVKQVVAKPGQFLIEETSFDTIDAEILDIFNQEADGYFKVLDKSLLKLDNQIKDESALKDIERVSHSLKSSSRMLGLAKVSGLTAVVELIAERCNEKELEMSVELKDVMRSTVQSIMQLIDRKPQDITPVLSVLLKIEAVLSAPNIFIGNIPGASAFASTGLADSKPIETADVYKPVPVLNESTVKSEEKIQTPKKEPKPEPKKDYFAKIGVDEEIVEIFKEEAATYFKLITNSLIRLRDNPSHESAMRDIEKSAHSLRSSAKMLGFQKIGDVVRPVETVAERVNSGMLSLDTRVLDAFDDALDILKKLGDGIDADITELIGRLSQIEKQEAPSQTIKQESVESLKVGESLTDTLSKESKGIVKPAVTRKKIQKAAKAQSAYFADISFKSDPILKQLEKGSTELLQEMSQSATQ